MKHKDDFVFCTDEQVNILQTYIEENYTLDGTSRSLIRGILDYVAAQEDDSEIILDLLTGLLDPIGISREELIKVVP